MMKKIIVEWNPWWGEEYSFTGVKREKFVDILPWIKRREIVSIMGIRRAGKTTLLFEIIHYLIHDKKISPKNIFFIKADDDRVDPGNLIDNAINEYERLLDPVGEIFVFIDEIQEIKEWQKTLKRIYDLKKNVKLFISGSNASILREELSSLLAGRYASFELFPFTFLEFLRLKRIEIDNGLKLYAQGNRIHHFLTEYLHYGAFPEVILTGNKKIKEELISFYFDSIFYRDVIKRNTIRNPAKLERLVKYYLQNISNLANFTKIGKILDLTTDSIVDYTRALENAYLIFPISLFDFSYKKQIINPKKIYCVDTGIRTILGFTFSDDLGRIYENVVFIHLRRGIKEIYYWAGAYECDFITKHGKELSAIQVCYDIKNSKEREVNGLLEALHYFKLREGIIITEDFEAEEILENKTIKYIPLWKWLIQ